MAYKECKQCGSLEHDCICKSPELTERDSNGHEINSNENNGENFLGVDFNYVAGDPFW